MLTGEGALPETRDRRERMERSRFDAIVPLSKNPKVPKQLGAIVDKMLTVKPDARYQTYDDILRDLRAVEALFASGVNLERPESNEALDGFPPGPPRVMFVHEKEKLHPDVKAKLEKWGYPTVCNVDVGRAIMLHELKPFHALVLDIGTLGKSAMKVGQKAKFHADQNDRKLALIFLANSRDEARLTADLEDEMTTTLVGEPVTLSQVREALAKVLPGAAKRKESKADAKT